MPKDMPKDMEDNEMSVQDVAEKVYQENDTAMRGILAEILAIDPAAIRIGPASNLFDLGLDSTNVVEIFLMIERRFSLQLDENDLTTDLFERYENLLAFIDAKRRVGG